MSGIKRKKIFKKTKKKKKKKRVICPLRKTIVIIVIKKKIKEEKRKKEKTRAETQAESERPVCESESEDWRGRRREADVDSPVIPTLNSNQSLKER